MDEMEALTENAVLVGERQYEAALDVVIASAQRELLIFDNSMLKGGYAGIRRYELLRDFLARDQNNRLVLILHDTGHFTSHCPRLLELLATYSHIFTVYQTTEAARVARDCFVIADQARYLRRFHIDQPRFKFSLGDIETASMLMLRFEELLQATSHIISPTSLGL